MGVDKKAGEATRESIFVRDGVLQGEKDDLVCLSGRIPIDALNSRGNFLKFLSAANSFSLSRYDPTD